MGWLISSMSSGTPRCPFEGLGMNGLGINCKKVGRWEGGKVGRWEGGTPYVGPVSPPRK